VASYDKAIPPGGEGRVVLQVRTKGYQGPIKKTGVVITDDPRNESITLALKAEVKVPIFISSRHVYLSAPVGQTATRQVELKGELDQPLTLEPAAFDLEGKVAYEIEELEQGKHYRVTFRTLGVEADSFMGALTLKTSYADMPEVQMRIRGVIGIPGPHQRPSTPISLSRRFVHLVGGAGQPASQSVEIKAESSAPLTLTVAEYSLEGKVDYRIEEVEAGRLFRVHFTSRPGVEDAYRGYLKLKTSYAAMPEIVLQVLGLVPSGKGDVTSSPPPAGS